MADSSFRDKDYAEAVRRYTRAIGVDCSNVALFSNRAACRERLYKGEADPALLEAGLADGRECVALDPGFARGHQRLAAFLELAVRAAVAGPATAARRRCPPCRAW